MRNFTKCLFLYAMFLVSVIIFFVSVTLIETKIKYRNWRPEPSKEYLLVMVVSRRDAFEARRQIRQTWSSSQKNVRFMVGEHFCGYPPEQQMQGKCATNHKTVSVDHLQQYLRKEEYTTERLRLEPNVVLLPVSDTYEQARKVYESYAWALRNTDTKWILTVFDDSYVRIRLLEKYLRNNFNPEDNVIVIGETGDAVNITENRHLTENASFDEKYTPISLIHLGHIASRPAAKYAVSGGDFYSVLKIRAESQMAQSLQWKISENMTNVGDCNDNSKLVITHTVPTKNMRACSFIDSALSNTKLTEQKLKALNITTEYAGNFLHWQRFDVIIKMVYAFFYSIDKHVPDIFERAYTEHLRVWNRFQEYCSHIKPYWFDSALPCKDKKNKSDFVSSFHDTITSIQKNGFRSDTSQIPVDKGGIILNGAHRIAAATVLSKNATFQHTNTSYIDPWDYLFFQKSGLTNNLTDISMLEWMKIQLELPRLTSKVFILSVFSTDPAKDKNMRKIVLEKCSNDNGILYEKNITVNKLGMSQLVTHMYGNQPWIEDKIDHMLSIFNFKASTFKVFFMFFFGKTLDELTDCKHDIRTLYNHTYFKSSAHIPDSPEESLILAEMVLNPNSVQFLNNAKNGEECRKIATEVARRSSLKAIPTLPGLFLGRDDLMIDSGSVLHLFNLRNRTDVDILFLHEIDKRILGNVNDFRIEAHAFKSNAISAGRAWGEDHFTETVKTKWDLFYDPANYGFCYGVKFVSLEQLVRYKLKRKEPQKDQYDVKLIRDMLHK